MIAVLAALILAPTPKKLLVVTHTTGFRHTSIPNAEKALGELAKADKRFTVAYCRTGEDVKKMLTVKGMAGYDGVVFANTSGNLGIPSLPAFLNWIKGGKAFIAMHSGGADTYRAGQPEGDIRFRDMVGASFREHGQQSTAVLVVSKRPNPATRHLKTGQKFFDEIYHFNEPASFIRKNATVLLSLNRWPDDRLKGQGTKTDMPLAWVKSYGKGRVFYTALGHREESWEDPAYRKHVLGGILWALHLSS